MRNFVRFPRDLLAQARAADKHAFAVAVDIDGGGRYQAVGLMEPYRAAVLWLFAHHLKAGLTPAEALEKTMDGLTDAAREALTKGVKP